MKLKMWKILLIIFIFIVVKVTLKMNIMEIDFNYFILSKRDKNNLSVCLIDLNGLKSVNNIFGHIKGDELIGDICEMLRSSIRESDI